jgi:hypothetical protein
LSLREGRIPILHQRIAESEQEILGLTCQREARQRQAELVAFDTRTTPQLNGRVVMVSGAQITDPATRTA